MSKIYVIRHGETDYNVMGKYCGSTNIDLNNVGILQAQQSIKEFEDKNIDVIVVSSLQRARHTAEIINKILCKPMEVRDDLVEITMGVYEGLTRAEAQSKYPEMWAACTPKGREDETKVQERIFSLLDELKQKYKNKNILIVTHGYITKVINRYFTKANAEEFTKYRQENCEIKEYIF